MPATRTSRRRARAPRARPTPAAGSAARPLARQGPTTTSRSCSPCQPSVTPCSRCWVARLSEACTLARRPSERRSRPLPLGDVRRRLPRPSSGRRRPVVRFLATLARRGCRVNYSPTPGSRRSRPKSTPPRRATAPCCWAPAPPTAPRPSGPRPRPAGSAPPGAARPPAPSGAARAQLSPMCPGADRPAAMPGPAL